MRLCIRRERKKDRKEERKKYFRTCTTWGKKFESIEEQKQKSKGHKTHRIVYAEEKERKKKEDAYDR